MKVLAVRGGVVLLNMVWVLLGDRLSLPAQLSIPIVSVLLWGWTVMIRGRTLSYARRSECRRRSLHLLFVYYLAMLMVILILGGLFHVSRGHGGEVNLQPLHTIRNYWILYQRTGNFESVSNLLGNVIILMPLGVLLPVVFPELRRAWLAVLILALVSVGVEVLQYLLEAGTADVDDSLLNFLGGWLGYAITRTAQLILK